MRRSLWSSTMRAAVVLPALLVVLLGTPLPVAAAPESEPTWVAHHGWTPASELAFLAAVDVRMPRAAAAMEAPASTVGPDRRPTRR